MNEEEIYLFLELNGKLDHNFFQKENIYFKMVNLNTDNPLVQIGNFVFQGNYDDFLGTKVFFMEDKNFEPGDNVFIKETPIHLKYIAKTVKVMQLKWRKLLTNVIRIDNKDCFDLKFTEDYNTVLEKFEKASLDMRDIIHDSNKEVLKEGENRKDEAMEVEDISSDKLTVEKMEDENEGVVENNLEVDKCTLLKDLAQTPVKRKEMQKVYEIKKEHLAKADDPDNFSVLSQLFIQAVTLKNEKDAVDDKDFGKYVDVRKSIEDGVIEKTDPDCLTNEQKASLLNTDNFDNFTLPMKLTYLTEQLEEYKRIWKTKTAADLRQVDDYGRTFKDRYRLLKKITKRIWFHIYYHCSDYAS